MKQKEGQRTLKDKSFEEIATTTMGCMKKFAGRLEAIGIAISGHPDRLKELPRPCDDPETVIAWTKQVINLLRELVLFQERLEAVKKQGKIGSKKGDKVKRTRQYYKYLDELKGNGLINAPDIIPLLVEKFPYLDKASALQIVVKWAEKDLVKK